MNALVLAASMAAPGATALRAAELPPRAAQAWNRCIREAEASMQARTCRNFLWVDEDAGRAPRLRQGEILAEPAVAHGAERAFNSLIHHWIGGVFIPQATIAELLAVTHDYPRYKDFYRPLVVDSKTIALSPREQQFSLVWQRRILFLDIVIEGQYRSRDFALCPGRGFTVTDAARIEQIEDYGKPSQRRLPPGAGSGYIWGLHSIARYEERDGGLYLEMETFVLTRDIPQAVRWFVVPLVARLSMNSVTACLRETRDAVRLAAVAAN